MVSSQRFWNRVRKTESCWIWTGYLDRDGYGKFMVNGKPILSHRFAYKLINGRIPEGYEVDHLCHNPSCVNPAHLEAVTIEVNNWRAIIFRRKSQKAKNFAHYI